VAGGAGAGTSAAEAAGTKSLDMRVVFPILRATQLNLGGTVDSDLLHTEKILADRKTFYLDLKQNSRGMVVKITEDVGGNRDTIMVPAEILGDFIAALSDIKATADENE
jgi:hypothetical protein